MLRPILLAKVNTDRIEPLAITPIGLVHSPYGQKFAVPRQPGLAPHAEAVIEFFSPYDDEKAFYGLQGFSHIHLIFLFDLAPYDHFKATVRPPRLGGNTRRGVFATRSPFRPSRLGLSVVRLLNIEVKDQKVRLRIGGADLVDGTPVVDIKPYIPFVDAVPEAQGGFAVEPPRLKAVTIPPKIEAVLKDELGDRRLLAIAETLAQDPRPTYKGDGDNKLYFARLYNYDIGFKSGVEEITVEKIVKLGEADDSI